MSLAADLADVGEKGTSVSPDQCHGPLIQRIKYYIRHRPALSTAASFLLPMALLSCLSCGVIFCRATRFVLLSQWKVPVQATSCPAAAIIIEQDYHGAENSRLVRDGLPSKRDSASPCLSDAVTHDRSSFQTADIWKCC